MVVLVVMRDEEVALFLLLLLVGIIIKGIVVIDVFITFIIISFINLLFTIAILLGLPIPILTPIILTTFLLNQLHQLNPHNLPDLNPLPLNIQLTASKPLHRIKHITQPNHRQHQQQYSYSKWRIYTYRWLFFRYRLY